MNDLHFSQALVPGFLAGILSMNAAARDACGRFAPIPSDGELFVSILI
jgi:hypothetical protein